MRSSFPPAVRPLTRRLECFDPSFAIRFIASRRSRTAALPQQRQVLRRVLTHPTLYSGPRKLDHRSSYTGGQKEG